MIKWTYYNRESNHSLHQFYNLCRRDNTYNHQLFVAAHSSKTHVWQGRGSSNRTEWDCDFFDFFFPDLVVLGKGLGPSFFDDWGFLITSFHSRTSILPVPSELVSSSLWDAACLDFALAMICFLVAGVAGVAAIEENERGTLVVRNNSGMVTTLEEYWRSWPARSAYPFKRRSFDSRFSVCSLACQLDYGLRGCIDSRW